MTTIYIVTQGSYSDYRIESVFSTQEKAEDFCALLRKHGRDRYDQPQIEEYELDITERQEFAAGLWPYFVRISRDGHGWANSTSPMIEEDMGLRLEGALLKGVVWAKHEQHALKIANERRAQMIANGDWE